MRHVIPSTTEIGSTKGNYVLTQLQTIFLELQNEPLTASMLSEITEIPQKNICRYKRDLEKLGRLWEVKKSICRKTGFRAWYLTTDPTKAPSKSIQMELFPND